MSRPPQDSSLGLTPPCSSSSVLTTSMVLYASHGLDPVAIINARNLSYSEVACVAVLTWDVFINFADEVRSVMS